MCNVTFAKSLDVFVRNEKQAGNAFASLVEYATSVIAGVAPSEQADVLGNNLKREENEYKGEKKIDHMPTAYRSAKSVVVTAVKAGVSLVGEDGKPKGKSELEKECKELRSEKSADEKFAIAMNTATNVFAQCETLEQVRKCKELVRQLADIVVKAEAGLIGK